MEKEFLELKKWYFTSLKKSLDEFILDKYAYEQNNAITRALVCNYVTEYIEDDLHVTGFGKFVREFNVVCDETNNPPSVIDNCGLCWNAYFKLKNGKIYRL